VGSDEIAGRQGGGRRKFYDIHHASASPIALEAIERIAALLAAKGSEYALYALLLAQPILGLLQTNARGDRVDLFFLGQLPALIGQDRPLAWQLLAVHEIVGFLLLGLIALHISAALFHHFWRRDDTLAAMLPSAAGHRQTGPRALAISVQSPSSRRG
jgi:cytochrome b561